MAETPAELGLAAEDTWDYLQPRYAVLAISDDAGDGLSGTPWYTEAVLLVSSADGFVVCAPAQSIPDAPVVQLPAEAQDAAGGGGEEVLLDVGYAMLDHGSFVEVHDPVPVGANFAMFGEPG